MVRLRNSIIRPLVAKIIFHGNKESLPNQQRFRCHKNEFFISFKNNRNVSEQVDFFCNERLSKTWQLSFEILSPRSKLFFRGPSTRLGWAGHETWETENVSSTQNKLKCWACILCSLLFLRLNQDWFSYASALLNVDQFKIGLKNSKPNLLWKLCLLTIERAFISGLGA